MSNTIQTKAASQIKVGLLQVSFNPMGQSYFPYSVAILQAYAEKYALNPQRFSFSSPIFKRLPINEIVNSIVDRDVVGFSIYTWNNCISLEIARRLKELNPEVIIVFGGPNVPPHSETFLRQNPFIDIAIHGEGERSFLALLEQYPNIDKGSIKGSRFIGIEGNYCSTAQAHRIDNLDEIPSPYLTGVFDRLITEYPKENWIGLLETNRGCPFQCSFCEWSSATSGKVRKFDIARVLNEIDWFSNKRIKMIFCCDANFGMFNRDVKIATYVAAKKKASVFPDMFYVHTTKNATNRTYAMLKILSDARLSMGGICLSMQSLDYETLVNIKRDNISLDTYFDLQQQFNQDRVATYCDLILGLPGETYNSFVDGINRLIESGQHDLIKFYNLSILPNAQMGDPSYRKRYGMEIVRTRIVIPGTHTDNEDDVGEFHDIVISTASMPAPEWRRARVFGWMTTLLHFDKLMQIPFIILHEISGISYRFMIEAVMDVNDSFQLLTEIRDFLFAQAESIQNGGLEYPFSKHWLNRYWPNDQYIFIKMTAENKLNQFYSELAVLFTKLIYKKGDETSIEVLKDALALNHALIRQPLNLEDVVVTTSYDIINFFRAVLDGKAVMLRREPTVTVIKRSLESYSDFHDWCRKVVLLGKQNGSYLYPYEMQAK
jgi:radical SAM superfamily enzyme YgiQ (UPF0313 family)